MEEIKSRGVAKGSKREWNIHKNKKTDYVDKSITLKITEKEYERLKKIRQSKKLNNREILVVGIEKLENEE